MQPNPKSATRTALIDASHSKSYDPSEAIRARMMPPPPPVTTMMPSNTQNPSNPTFSQDAPPTNIDPRTGAVKRIPQYFYPRYNDDDEGPPSSQPNPVDPRETNPNLLPPPPPPHVQQPIPLSVDPYGSGQYYPYGTPYLIPMTTNLPPVNSVPNLQEQSKSEVINSHQKDADLSRLEVYHFTPKHNVSSSTGAFPSPPVVQYHVYPYPPGSIGPPIPSQQLHQQLPPYGYQQAPGAPLIPLQQPQQQFSPYPHPWYGYPPNGPPYAPEPPEPVLPYTETKARGSQTEQPSTKTRGVSPIRFTHAEPLYDDEGYPYVYQRVMPRNRHDITPERINRHFYDSNRSTPLSDCRCLDCQREQKKVLNYYPD